MTQPRNRTWAPGQSAQRLELVLNGLRRIGITATTANMTATLADDAILADATAGNITVTLPVADKRRKIPLTVKKVDASANTVTIAAAGAETIDGGASLAIGTQYQSYTVVSDGTDWWVL